MTPTLPVTAIIMVDIETLATKSDSVVTQLAFMAAAATDVQDRLDYDSFTLPIQSQLDAGRRVDAKTLAWWFAQNEKARLDMASGIEGDSDSMVAFIRAFIRKVKRVIDTAVGMGGDYEIWARGPQFDIVNLESLFELVGEVAPWDYSKVRDLRTLMKAAGISSADVDSSDIVQHIALEDCRFQLRCYEAAMAKLEPTVEA